MDKIMEIVNYEKNLQVKNSLQGLPLDKLQEGDFVYTDSITSSFTLSDFAKTLRGQIQK